MITDHVGKLRYVNPAWTEIYGYSRAEALGQSPNILRSDLHDASFYRDIWRDILDLEIGFWKGQVVNLAKDGHLVPVLLTITPFSDENRINVGYMGIAVDLSEQKHLQRQLLQQDRIASIGLLASGLAHEIGNPLAVMQGRAELLLHDIHGNPSAEVNVGIIQSQIERISNLIQSLLRVSRVPESIKLSDVMLEPIIKEVIILLGENIRKSDIDIRVVNVDQTLLAEESFLQQMLLNLLINSIHAIEERTPTPNLPRGLIEITAQSSQSGCVICVLDNGVGISKENLPKVTDPFFTTKPAGVGTGMGLAIVAKIVGEMQGFLKVESKGLGLGCLVSIHLKRI